MYIQDIMNGDLETAKKHSILAATPVVGVFIGVTFVPAPSGQNVEISIVNETANGYVRKSLDDYRSGYDILARYVEVGRVINRALFKDITWEETVEAIEIIVGQVIKV